MQLRWMALWLVAIVVAQRVFVQEQFFSSPELVRRTLILGTAAGSAGLAIAFVGVARTATVAAVGAFLNLAVIVANGGAMPVAFEDAKAQLPFEVTEADLGNLVPGSKDVLLLPEDMRLSWLSDRHLLWFPTAGRTLYSLGDLVLYAGVTLAWVEVVVRIARGGITGPRKPEESHANA